MVIPPLELIKDCAGSTDADNYVFIGAHYHAHFVRYFQPGDRVLEIGCGVGRMAQSLENDDIEYWGWDVSKRAVDWCNESINLPKFHFQHFDVLNRYYNPAGQIRPDEFVMPYEDGFFDFVFLASVFTHVLTPVVKHYLKEISRVLKKGKPCLATFFLLNDGKRDRTPFKFFPFDDASSVVYAANPEAIVGYEESWVRRAVDVTDVTYEYQDIVVFRNTNKGEG